MILLYGLLAFLGLMALIVGPLWTLGVVVAWGLLVGAYVYLADRNQWPIHEKSLVLLAWPVALGLWFVIALSWAAVRLSGKSVHPDDTPCGFWKQYVQDIRDTWASED